MPSVRLTSRYLKLLIGADLQDWSESVGPVVLSWESLDTGLIKTTGRVDIVQCSANPESVDPRSNPARWRPGQTLRLQVHDDSGAWADHPMGRLFILDDPDPPIDGGGITLSVGCWLAWADSFEFDGDETGVALGTGEASNLVASRLLQAQGIPSGSISLSTWPYTLDWPKGKSGQSSYVAQAADLAYSNDYRYLYQNPAGTVTQGQLSLTPATPTVTITLGTNDVLWQPSRDPQRPVEEVKAAGVGYDIEALESGTSETTATFGNKSDYAGTSCTGSGIVETLRTSTEWDDSGDPITYTSSTTLGALRGAVYANPADTSLPCDLLEWQEVTTVRSYDAGTKRLEQVVEQTRQREATLAAGTGVPLQWRTAKLVTTTYSYSDEETISATVTTEQVAEVVMDSASDNPFNLRVVRQEAKRWRKVGELWELSESVGVARIARDSGVDKFSSNIWALITESSPPRLASDGSTAPPKTEFWGEGVTEKERHYEGIAAWVHPGGATGRTRKRLYTVPFGFSNAQMEGLAEKHRDLLVGRNLGAAIELPISDALLTAPPLFQVDVVDDGTTYSYLADGVTWAHAGDQASVFATGIWIGGGYDRLVSLEDWGGIGGSVGTEATFPATEDWGRIGIGAGISAFFAEPSITEDWGGIGASVGIGGTWPATPEDWGGIGASAGISSSFAQVEDWGSIGASVGATYTDQAVAFVGSIGASIGIVGTFPIREDWGGVGASVGIEGTWPSSLLNNLVAWWSLDEASGNRADSHTSSYTLTQTGAVGSTTGKVGNAATGFSSSNYLSNSNSAFNPSGSFYVAGWVRFTNVTTSQTVIGKYATTTNNRGWLVYLGGSDSKMVLQVSSNGAAATVAAVASTSTITANTWTFVEAYYNHAASQIGIAVNGEAFSTVSFTGPIFASTAPLICGLINTSSPTLIATTGSFDEILIMSRVPTSAERAELYAAGAGISYPG